MKIKAIATGAVAALLLGGLLAPAGAAPKGPVVVGTDAAGDWGAGVDANLAAAGAAAGMDLTEASIGMADAATVNFVIKVASLPAPGGTPEAARYTWDFTVNGKTFNLDGKFTNYSRGACDVLSGSCPPPRDPGMQPFQLKGDCAPDPNATNVTVCKELAIVKATFDSAAGTITIPVTLALLKAKKGSKIGPGTGSLFGGTVEAFPSAYLSSNSMPSDTLTATGTFTVPKK